jgi:hypothetical protein
LNHAETGEMGRFWDSSGYEGSELWYNDCVCGIMGIRVGTDCFQPEDLDRLGLLRTTNEAPSRSAMNQPSKHKDMAGEMKEGYDEKVETRGQRVGVVWWRK